jgi:hypothetical protein
VVEAVGENAPSPLSSVKVTTTPGTGVPLTSVTTARSSAGPPRVQPSGAGWTVAMVVGARAGPPGSPGPSSHAAANRTRNANAETRFITL